MIKILNNISKYQNNFYNDLSHNNLIKVKIVIYYLRLNYLLKIYKHNEQNLLLSFLKLLFFHWCTLFSNSQTHPFSFVFFYFFSLHFKTHKKSVKTITTNSPNVAPTPTKPYTRAAIPSETENPQGTAQGTSNSSDLKENVDTFCISNRRELG